MRKLRRSLWLWIFFGFSFFVSIAHAQNHVLSLDGDGDYVEITNNAGLNAISSQVTMEAWIHPTAFPNQWMPLIYKGDKRTSDACENRSYALWLHNSGVIQLASAPSGQRQMYLNSPNGLIALNRWSHVAGVIDAKQGVMRLFLNGTEVARRPFEKEIHVSALPLRIGGSHEAEFSFHSHFAGQIDEVRVWNVARTQAEIAANLFTPLSGKEAGLVGYWRFEEQGGKVIDATGNGHEGKFVSDAKRVLSELPTFAQSYQDYLESLQLELSVRRRKPSELTDVFSITAHRVPKSTVWKTPSVPVRIEIRDDAQKLLGSLQSRTDQPVDWAVPDGVVGTLGILVKQTDTSGKTQEAKFTCRAHSTVPVTPIKGYWQTYNVTDGLGASGVVSMIQDRNGVLWFGLLGGGICRYDGHSFRTFTTQDGLPSNDVWTIYEDSRGNLWIGTLGGGLCTYDGKKFVRMAGKKELGDGWNWISFLLEDRRGNMWVSLVGGGVCRYDGLRFTKFNTDNGLPNNTSWELLEDRSGNIWIPTLGGIARYDGTAFQTFTVKDGLAENQIERVFEDSKGNLWFGVATGGVHKFDGKNFQQFTTADGLLHNFAWGIEEDDEGNMIFATSRGLTIYTPPQAPIPPPVTVTEVVADKVYENPSEGFKPSEGLRIPSTTPRITFSYYGMSFKTKRMRYNYMLEGYDKDWQKTWDEEASYNNLKPGEYTFKVIAINRDLVYSETPATVHLTIATPWYLNGWIMFPSGGAFLATLFLAFYYGKRLQTQRAIAQQFNPYIAGRVVGSDLFFGRSDIITDIERTLANNCFLLYGERRIGKSSIQHQLRERLQNADDPTYKFIPAYIDLQGVSEDDFFRTIAASVVEHAASLFKEPLTLRLNADDLADRLYSYRDLNRDLRAIIDHLKEGETKAIKIVLLMDEVDTLNTYSLRTNLNLRGLFMGPLKENLVLVMSGLYLKMDWSAEGGGSPPFNFLSREIQIQPLDEASARRLITEPVKGFYTCEPKAIDLIISLSEFRPFTIQAFCLRAVNRILADGRTRIAVADIEGIKDSVLAEVASIRGERAGTSLPVSLNEAVVRLNEANTRIQALEAELAKRKVA